jgi:8-oxo-dGTP pyrophosphatase MutT (NUDIX family)
VVVRYLDGVIHVLLIRDPYGNWGLPKGHVEEGEGAIAAAAREVREETGLTVLRLGPEIGVIDWFFRVEGRVVHKFCTFHLMACDVGTPVPERAEGITECVWLPAREAIERVTYENAREIVRDAVRMVEAGDPWSAHPDI